MESNECNCSLAQREGLVNKTKGMFFITAFDVMVQYANAQELVGRKEEYEKEGKVDMCKAITEWLAEEREAGMQAGIQRGMQTGMQTGIQTGMDDKTRNVVINMLKRGMSDEDIIAIAECPQELIDELRSQRTRI